MLQLLVFILYILELNFKSQADITGFAFKAITGVQYNGHYLWRNSMPEREVCSPVTRKGSKVGSGQPLSPGARSAPSRRDAAATPTAQPQSQRRAATHQEEPEGTIKVTGPEE
jgi:hypothetical protein